MILEIKLDNFKYCNGCPALYGNCKYYQKELPKLEKETVLVMRPEKCLLENGA